MRKQRNNRRKKLPHETDKTLSMLDLICGARYNRDMELVEHLEAPNVVRISGPISWDALTEDALTLRSTQG
jgi:hypothetical protein